MRNLLCSTTVRDHCGKTPEQL
uniref:Uncharacterized protein n=1 Tax=Heterorhabditis bacteriophora TaxID=37862 RepID=A0A1I7WKS9_HETBA